MKDKPLYNLRRKKGYNQQEVADYLGITRQMYNLYEKDAGIMKVVTLIKILDFIGATKAERKKLCDEIIK